VATTTKKKPVPPKSPVIKKKTLSKVEEAPKKPEPSDGLSMFHGARIMSGVDPVKAKKQGVQGLVALKALSDSGINPRSKVGDVRDLAAAIKSEGLLQPLVVRPGKKIGAFDVIAGHRRLKALQSIDYKEDVPVLIRVDLLGDDDRALAVSISENSEDGRVNLNMIEIGRAVQKLEKRKWTVARIASESGLNPQRVRRALALMDTPSEVQTRVADGTWSAAAGLEYAKLDDATRSRIKSKLTEAVTASDIRRARKEAQREETAKGAAKGEAATPKTKDGKSVGKRPVIALWRGSREKTEKLQELCHVLENAAKEDIGTPDYHEIRGSVATLLWDRGDRTSPLPPDLEPNKKDPDYASIQKDLATFQSVIKAEAGRHRPADEPKAPVKKK
jgi:ParB/RepB/Spo0J family partition protein